MNYISTRGTASVLGFGEAMMTGLARDGGLYVPEIVPALSTDEIAALAGLPYEEVAFRVMQPYLGGFFSDDEFKGLIAKAYEQAEASLLAPLAFTEIIMATILGWWFFGDLPDRWTVLGVTILIGSAIYISVRERRSKA